MGVDVVSGFKPGLIHEVIPGVEKDKRRRSEVLVVKVKYPNCSTATMRLPEGNGRKGI